ncbi:MAG: A/G-specific adenine glycosylase [Chloroflexota bacterium]
MNTSLSNKIISWYQKNKRDLPWRDDTDPYRVWVSEIMAQQTRLETVIPYFERWMARFPTIQSLASADQQEVLSIWEGLGYYSRARNLHHAARVVVETHAGVLPKYVKTLRTLPGIGRYTAGAIASLAFQLDEPIVDGNIKRVYARIFNIKAQVNTPAGEKEIWVIAEKLLPKGKSRDYNQALMDLGATVCAPQNPKCRFCPLTKECQAYSLGIQDTLPNKKVKAKIPHHIVTAAVIKNKKQVLIAQRPQTGLLAGLWEFPGGKQEKYENLETCLRREIKEELGVDIQLEQKIGIYNHAYTHFKVTLHAFSCRINKGKPQALEADELHWVELNQLQDFPMGKIDRMISQDLMPLVQEKK